MYTIAPYITMYGIPPYVHIVLHHLYTKCIAPYTMYCTIHKLLQYSQNLFHQYCTKCIICTQAALHITYRKLLHHTYTVVYKRQCIIYTVYCTVHTLRSASYMYTKCIAPYMYTIYCTLCTQCFLLHKLYSTYIYVHNVLHHFNKLYYTVSTQNV